MTPGDRSIGPRSAASGAFGWSAGAWFGSVFGATFWLSLLGGWLLAVQHAGAWIALAGFLALVGLGVGFWRARARRSAYRSIQIFLLAAWCVFLAVLGGIEASGGLPSDIGDSRSAWAFALLIPPALIALFALRERAARRTAVHGSRNAP